MFKNPDTTNSPHEFFCPNCAKGPLARLEGPNLIRLKWPESHGHLAGDVGDCILYCRIVACDQSFLCGILRAIDIETFRKKKQREKKEKKKVKER